MGMHMEKPHAAHGGMASASTHSQVHHSSASLTWDEGQDEGMPLSAQIHTMLEAQLFHAALQLIVHLWLHEDLDLLADLSAAGTGREGGGAAATYTQHKTHGTTSGWWRLMAMWGRGRDLSPLIAIASLARVSGRGSGGMHTSVPRVALRGYG